MFSRLRRCGLLAALMLTGLMVGVTGPVLADTFGDDDGEYYEPALDVLAELGILEGTECGEGLICPDQEIERWVMAVWLVRVLDRAEAEPVSASRFEDVDVSEWWMPFVERLAVLEVTQGCAVEPARFCPEQSVTRGQMATFLTRALDLVPHSSAGFVDIKGNYHEASINALAAARITRGCATEPARFCPESSVTRGQMATLLARSLDLVPRPPTVGQLEPPGLPEATVRMGIYPCCADFAFWQIPVQQGWFEELNITLASGSPHYFTASQETIPWLLSDEGDVAGAWVPSLFYYLETFGLTIPPILFHGAYNPHMILVSPFSQAKTVADYMDDGLSYPYAAQHAVWQLVGKDLYLPPHSTTQPQYADPLFAYLDQWWQDLETDIPLLDAQGNPLVLMNRDGSPVEDPEGKPYPITITSRDWRHYAHPQYVDDSGIVELSTAPGSSMEFAMPYGATALVSLIRNGWKPLNSLAMVFELDGASSQATLAGPWVGGTGLLANREWVERNRETAYRLLSVGFRTLAFLNDPVSQHDGWGLVADLINTKRRTSWEPADIGILLNDISLMAAWENQETLWNVDLPGYHPKQSFFSWIERLRIVGFLSEDFDTEANLDTLLLAQDLYYEMKAMQVRSDELFAKAEDISLSESQALMLEQARIFYDRYNFLDSLRYLETALER